MPLLFILVLIAVIGVMAALLSGRATATMAPATTARQQFTLPSGKVDSTDVERLRFSVGLRGYRMDEVDAVLDRLRDEIGLLREEAELRDREIMRLHHPSPQAPLTDAAAPVADTSVDPLTQTSVPTERLEDPFGTAGRPSAY